MKLTELLEGLLELRKDLESKGIYDIDVCIGYTNETGASDMLPISHFCSSKPGKVIEIFLGGQYNLEEVSIVTGKQIGRAHV